MIAIPTAGRVPIDFATSLAGLVSKITAQGVSTMPGVQVEAFIKVCASTNWISNREILVRSAVDEGMTHLLFLDDDMVFDASVLDLLFSRQKPIVVTNYLIKKDQPDFVAVSLDGKHKVRTLPESTGIELVGYSGFGVSLFDIEVFKSVPQPWFLPEFNPETGRYTTEDAPFFYKAHKAGFPVYLDHDASKLLGHVGTRTWNWDEVRFVPNAKETN